MKYMILFLLSLIVIAFVTINRKPVEDEEFINGMYTTSFYQACLFADKMAQRDYIPENRDPRGIYRRIHEGDYPKEFKTDTLKNLFGMP